MSASAAGPTPPISGEFQTPEQEQAEKGRDVAAARDLALEDINPLNAHLFRESLAGLLPAAAPGRSRPFQRARVSGTILVCHEVRGHQDGQL